MSGYNFLLSLRNITYLRAFCWPSSLRKHPIPRKEAIDNHAKDGGPGEVWLLCSFYHESLRTWIKTIVNKFAISNHTVLILSVHALRSYLKLIVNMSFIANQIKKLMAQRIMVKTTSRSDLLWSAIFLCNRLFYCLSCVLNKEQNKYSLMLRSRSHVTGYDSYLGELYADWPCVHTFPSLSGYFALLYPENVYPPLKVENKSIRRTILRAQTRVNSLSR